MQVILVGGKWISQVENLFFLPHRGTLCCGNFHGSVLGRFGTFWNVFGCLIIFLNFLEHLWTFWDVFGFGYVFLTS